VDVDEEEEDDEDEGYEDESVGVLICVGEGGDLFKGLKGVLITNF